jgi:hypothetical protein
MPVLMMVEIPGADAAFADAMRQAGVLGELQAARGFRGHWSGATSSGYRAIELWDSREDCQTFAESHFAPKLARGSPHIGFMVADVSGCHRYMWDRHCGAAGRL